MKAKLIYTEGSSYFGGKNPYGEEWESIIEANGEYYKIYTWGNYTNSGRTIDAIEFDPKNIPEEYDRVENNRIYSLKHKDGQEIEVDLTSFDTEYAGDKIPENLRDVYRDELRSLAKKRIEKTIESYPNLDYNAIVKKAELTEEQKENAQLIIDEIERELVQDNYLELADYTPIIENLVPLAKGESVIVTHKNSSYSRPEDRLLSLSKIKDGYGRFATSGLHWDHAWGNRDTKPDVFSLQGRKEIFKDGRSYLGSYWKEGYSIDMMQDQNGRTYIIRNIYENWANSQIFNGIIDVHLPVDRFDISTGEEGSFKEYNEQVHAKKLEKRNFYRGVMEQAKEQFGLSEEQANSLLDFAGTVSALSLATDFERNGLSTNQALAMLKKTSHRGMEKVLSQTGMEYPTYNFDIIQKAAETLAHIHSSENYTPHEIASAIQNVREGELTYTIGEILKNVELNIDKDEDKDKAKATDEDEGR